MSLVTKDSIIQDCANAYKEGTGVESIKVGELAVKIFEAITSEVEGHPSGITTGEFIPNEVGGTSSGNFAIEHNLNVKPNIILGWVNILEASSVVLAFLNYNPVGTTTPISMVFYLSDGKVVSEESNKTAEDDETYFFVPAAVSNTVYPAVLTYKWIAISKE